MVRPQGPRYPEADWIEGPWEMTRTHTLVIEGGRGGYSAYVPELPTILVTGKSRRELISRATEAIQLYWEMVRPTPTRTSSLQEIGVELPA
jgi:predicted RNase H-like HicB family nuclease